MCRCRHEFTSGGCPCRPRVVSSGPGHLAPSPPPDFSLHLDALSGLTRPVLGNEEIAAFAYWLIYPDFFNYLFRFSNPYLSYNHKAEETFIYFNLFLILFSFFFSPQPVFFNKQAGGLETSNNVEFWLTQFFKFWTSHFDVGFFPS